MGRSGYRLLLSFLLVVSLLPCVNSSLQPALAALEHALTITVDALTDAVSSSEKQCTRCKNEADPDCVPHILTKLRDEASVMEYKANRLQSDVQCDCQCTQVFSTEGRGPGFIIFEGNFDQSNVRVIAPNGTVTVDKETPDGEIYRFFYYNPLTERIFTGRPFRSFNMAFEDEQRYPRAPYYRSMSSFAGDPFTETLYYTERRSSRVSKVGMNGMGRETLGFGESRRGLKGGTLDICKGVFYFGDENKIKSVNVEGDPQIKDVEQFTTDIAISGMDIDAEAQKIYFCSEKTVYMYDLVEKTNSSIGSYSSYCNSLKLWKEFIYFEDYEENAITKTSIDGNQTEKLHEGLLPSKDLNLGFTLF